MAEAETLSITVTSEQAEALRAAVESSEYATPADAVREAIADWQLGRELRRDEVRHLRRLWDEGKASGPGAPLDFDELRGEARRRLATTGRTGS